MENFEMFERFIDLYKNDAQQNTKLFFIFGGIILINMIITILNIYAQFVLKNKDKLIFSFNIKETKRIEITEIIYKKIDDLSFFDGRNDNDIFLNKIQDLEKYMSSNKLFINKIIFKSTFEILDYYKSVITDFRKKDYQKEMVYISNFCKNFNK